MQPHVAPSAWCGHKGGGERTLTCGATAARVGGSGRRIASTGAADESQCHLPGLRAAPIIGITQGRSCTGLEVMSPTRQQDSADLHPSEPHNEHHGKSEPNCTIGWHARGREMVTVKRRSAAGIDDTSTTGARSYISQHTLFAVFMLLESARCRHVLPVNSSILVKLHSYTPLSFEAYVE